MKQDIIYFLEKREQNELMSRKHKTGCATLNYIEHFLILAFKITGCISIFYRNYKFCNRIKNLCDSCRN